jgi:hypothetical protein
MRIIRKTMIETPKTTIARSMARSARKRTGLEGRGRNGQASRRA